jgi:hypothetical protein
MTMVTVWRENIAPLLSEGANRAVRKRPEKDATTYFYLSSVWKERILAHRGDCVACTVPKMVRVAAVVSKICSL